MFQSNLDIKEQLLADKKRFDNKNMKVKLVLFHLLRILLRILDLLGEGWTKSYPLPALDLVHFVNLTQPNTTLYH